MLSMPSILTKICFFLRNVHASIPAQRRLKSYPLKMGSGLSGRVRCRARLSIKKTLYKEKSQISYMYLHIVQLILGLQL